ncbi:hypothetical protein UR09_01915 [Candidatus Nitromaritima sp. SCGC AAA799-A02]|nr:hypothetical protein UZ36_03510 [Candidatus Nitromaritima sp. SCGC AAA799-C22]KMP12065.1 hypothetical protein UR09_01915 [Candidatus Nitromaritima sp. SCGC AAA799-A02]
MQIKCTSCERSISLPDEKVPKDKAFTITCPGCKEKVKVDQHLKTEVPANASPPPPQEETVDTAAFAVSQEFEDDEDLIIYDENDKIALILDEKNKDAWTKALEEKEYKIQFAQSPEHAVHKMKFTQFHFVALEGSFGNVSLEKSLIYNTIIEMPMSDRRNIFFALVGDQFKTLNNMQAFAASANVVINQKDMEKVSDVLKKSITENDMFYKVYKETLHAMGKT